MRRLARTDGNQADIVDGLRKFGATVQVTSALGNGFVDIVVGYHGVNYLMEIKDPSQDKSHQALTPKEKTFHEGWRGQCDVVMTLAEALAVLGIR